MRSINVLVLTVALTLAAPLLQQSTIVPVLPLGSYAANTRPIPDTAIPSDTTKIAIWVERAAWTDPTAALNASFDVSLDGGATWTAAGGGGFVGGTITVPLEQRANPVFEGMGGSIVDQSTGTMLYSGYRLCIPEVGSTDRRLRGSVTNSKTITTRVSVELYTSGGC